MKVSEDLPRFRRFARINRAKRPFPMKKVYVARLAASHGAFTPASAVWRGSAARKSSFRTNAERGQP